MKKILSLLLVASFGFAIFAQKLEHETTDKNAPIVYYTKDISDAGLLKVYKALGQKVSGNVGLKVSFGSPNEQGVNPEYLTSIVKETNATMFDANGLSGNRWTADLNLAHAKAKGFDKIGNMEMMNEDVLDMKVNGGLVLDHARTGTNFAKYDTLISVHRFKMHNLPALGSNIKNITLCLSNRSGKCIIHSGGTDENHYHNTEPDVLMKAFADCAKAVTQYKKNWAFINIVDEHKSEDAHSSNRSAIGIFASSDVVALDQCSVDFELATSNASNAQKEQWKTDHQVDVLKYAEQIGVGKRNYRLVEIK